MIFISTESEAEMDYGDVYGFVPSAAFSKGDHVRLVHAKEEGNLLIATVHNVHGTDISIVLEGCGDQPLLFTVRAEDLELRYKREVCAPGPEWGDLADIRGLVDLLLVESEDRPRGSFESQPVLLRAGPGTGKTWSLQQMYYLLAKRLRDADEGGGSADTPLVPIVFYVQRLVRLMRKQKLAPGMDLLFEYIRDAHGDGERTAMLQQAIRLKAGILLIDGVDEAAGLRQMIEDLVHLHLVPQGHKVVVTSRPEGVRLPLYRKHFVVLNLKPLTDEQQSAMIKGQLQGNDFFEHLMAFAAIRRGHDDLYVSSAFADEDDRKGVEAFGRRNLFLIQDGSMTESFDPEQRQRCAGGGDFVAVLARGAQPESACLKAVQKALDAKVLRRLDELVRQAGASNDDDGAAQRRFERGATILELAPESFEWKAAKKLCLLSRKLGKQVMAGGEVPGVECGELAGGNDAALPSQLWPRIVRRTDAIYVVAERMKPVFEFFVKHAAQKEGIEESSISFGNLKDPVRIHEKAWDDYAGRFCDDVVPEACVVDVLRCRVVISSARKVISFLDSIARDSVFECDTGTGLRQFRCTFIRGKNKFREVDPTHFRNVLCNLRIDSVGGGGDSCFFEVQVQHEAILKFNDDMHAHAHCESFCFLFFVPRLFALCVRQSKY